MQRPSVISRIRVRRVSSFLAFSLVLFIIGSSLFRGFLGPKPKTSKAYDVEINTTNRYMLDGWEMSNSANIMGRVTPSVNRNGQSIRISNHVVQRMDNSASGFNNNPLFATISSSDPLTYSYQNTDGVTHLSDLEVSDAVVTNTPLDYLTLTEKDRFINSGYYAFGLKLTGYYYNTVNIPAMQITAAADDGCRIEAYYGGAWNTVSNDYSNHDMRFPNPATLTNINYTAGTFLPVRITYYNRAAADDTAGLTLFVKNQTGNWYIPTWGDSSLAGRFYALPAVSNSIEGLVVDVYQENGRYMYYNPTEFSSRHGLTFSNTTDFDLDNYRFSYRDVYYMNTFSNSTACTLQYNVAYVALPAVGTLTACDGKGGPFVLEDGHPPARYPATQELFTLDGYRDVFEWLGGRSRLKLDMTNTVNLVSASINVTGSGWVNGPLVSSSTYPDNNAKGYGGGVTGGTHWNGGGWQDYAASTNNGIAGGGSFGGYGDSAEWEPWRLLGRSNTYGLPNDVEYLGSGGGSANADSIHKSGGSGGGMIVIRAANIQMTANSSIKADGIKGFDEGAGGSGGGIHIVGDVNSADSSPEITANGGEDGFNDSDAHSGYGGGGRIYIEGNIGVDTDIKAKAGCDSVSMCGSRTGVLRDKPELWATDGTVLIKKSPVTVKKELIPVQRNTLDNSQFNPYTLQGGDLLPEPVNKYPGDIIKINLELRNLGYTACPGAPLPEKLSVIRTIYDEYLHTTQGKAVSCKYLDGSAIGQDANLSSDGIGLTDQGDKLRISLSCAAQEPVNVTYWCQVK